MKYKLYYYHKKPLVAIPIDYDIFLIYPNLKDKIRLLTYKQEIKDISKIIDTDFLNYFKKGIVYFHKNKIIVKDIKKKYIFIYADFSGKFYGDYNSFRFNSFRLPHLYEANEKFGVFEYIDEKTKEFSKNEIYEITLEIYDALGFNHGDFHKSNLLFNGSVYLIDWDDRVDFFREYDFLHYYLVDVFRKYEKKSIFKRSFFKKTKTELLKFCKEYEIDKAIEIISEKRGFKGNL